MTTLSLLRFTWISVIVLSGDRSMMFEYPDFAAGGPAILSDRAG